VCGYAAPVGVSIAAALWLSAARKGRAEVRMTCGPPWGYTQDPAGSRRL